MKKQSIILVLLSLLLIGIFSSALADGTEELGPPSIPIASGTGIVAAGTGMVSQPGSFDVSLPDGSTVEQVLLYWEGFMSTNVAGDDTIVVNGNNVTGTKIGGETFFFDGNFSSSFRADITNLDLVSAGSNTLTLDGLDFTSVSNGAGVLVIFNDGTGIAEIEVRDGVDLAFVSYPEPRRTTVPQTFNFPAASEERIATLSMFVSSVEGSVSHGGSPRPTSIEVTTGGVLTVFSDTLVSNGGDEWDSVNLPINIPAGADSLTVQVFSRDDSQIGNLPASLSWIVAGLMVPPSPDLMVEKSCEEIAFLGDDVAYEISVTNTGNVDLTDVEVDDSILGPLETIPSLEVGETHTINVDWTSTIAGEVENTATASASYGSTSVTNSASCTTDIFSLNVTKDVETSLNRSPNWQINKTVDGESSTELVLLVNETVSVTYEVLVDLGDPAFVDSDWVVSGTITVTNPAPMDATLDSVIDVVSDRGNTIFLPVAMTSDSGSGGTTAPSNVIPPGIQAPVDCPSLTVPAGGNLICTYGPVELRNDLAQTNIAIARLQNNNGGTTDFMGRKDFDFSMAEINMINDEIVVEDDMHGELGTVNVDEVPKTFTYSEEFGPIPSEECNQSGTVVNNATLINDDGSAGDSSSASVRVVCVESTTVGFEDLPLGTGNDWDYNDAVIRVLFEPAFSPSQDLLSITLNFTQPVNLSAYTHQFFIQPDVFVCDGTYSQTRNGVQVATDEPYQNGQDLLIIENTGNPTNTSELTINFDVPSPGDCPLDLSGFDPIGTFHGEGLFFVPRIEVNNTGESITPGDPRLLGVPIDWIWPDEKQAIWLVYPDVSPPVVIVEGPVFTPFWWENYQP